MSYSNMTKKIKLLIYLNIILVILTSLYAFFIKDKIDDIVPIHFNLLGQPDIYGYFDDSMLLFFPIISLLVCVLMLFIFYHPELACIPHTLFFILLENEIKEEVFLITRKYMIKLLTILNLIFVFIYVNILNIWIDISENINIYVVISLLAVFIFMIGLYLHNVKLLINKYISKKNKK